MAARVVVRWYRLAIRAEASDRACTRIEAKSRMRLVVHALTALSFAALTARAQTSAEFRWQASADSGVTWHDDAISVPQGQASVLVRARVSWSPATPGNALAGCSFDGVIDGAGPSDTADLFRRLDLGTLLTTTNLGATRFGSTIKIDHQLDTAPPGTGTRWIDCGNVVPGGNLIPNRAHPIDVFEFRLLLDGTPGTRTASQVSRVLTQPNGLVAIWVDVNSPQPTSVRPPTTSYPIAITVLPTPGAIALLAFGGVVAARRRRR